MATSSDENVLQCLPFTSSLDPSFWHELGKRKLEQYQLSVEPVHIIGHYTNTRVISSSFLSLDYNAFTPSSTSPSLDFPCHGTLRNTNTLANFKSFDKKAWLEEGARLIWESINNYDYNNDSLSSPHLSSFLLLTYADLKKYHFHYWFAFPALVPSQPITFNKLSRLETNLDSNKLRLLYESYDTFAEKNRNCGFFLVNRKDWAIVPLSKFNKVFEKGQTLTVGFCDPGTHDEYPGWPLRNFLFLITQKWSCDDLKVVDVLCYRDYTRKGQRSIGHSLLIEGVVLPPHSSTLPKVTGWERDDNNKLGPRFVDLSSNMDPKRLAESAVDLNLKLMRWRVIPSLDLSAMQDTKCLLLGAGTLGCNVSRCLLGWGVRKITLIDNSRVSYSNPVRQSLFQFKDCVDGGLQKALAAAESLKAVFPGVDAQGVELSIPMPGHAIGSGEKRLKEVRETVNTLEELIKSHDVVFLLMDTRESRWLPTLLAAVHSKLCLNAALGFDTFMVMRHGFHSQSTSPLEVPPTKGRGSQQHIPGSHLGCYFCNDVVAPTDSTRDRTLDQQCTVSRPGLSMVAGALVVELLSSLLQHPLKGQAPADSNPEQDDMDSPSVLGLVPHQIRGFLSRFQNVLPASERFDKCTACSDIVLEEYRKEGFEFLRKAFDSPNYLEDLTGLSQLYAETLDDHIWELSDGDD